MRKKQGGLISKILIGKEKSEGFARSTLPSNRIELFWDILKGRFGKLVVINLLMALFFIPLFLLLILRIGFVQNYGATYPFSQAFGVGYLAPASMVGSSENINYIANMYIYLFMPIALVIGAIGVSGGAYVIRNVVWTEGIFVSNDFWHGIKVNFKQIAIIALIYSLLFYITQFAISLSQQYIAMNNNLKWLFIVIEVVLYLVLSIISIMTLHMITMVVTYEVKTKQLFKNAFYLTIGAFPINVIMFVFGAIPFILCAFGEITTVIGVILMLIIGFSFLLLVWTDYSQWLYDSLINPKIGAQTNRGIYSKQSKNSEPVYVGKVRTAYNVRPIKPIDDDITLAELPTSFSRNDIERLNQSKQAMIEDNERYIEEHKNDAEFTELNKEIEERKTSEEERLKKIAKAKKELEKRNKGKR